MRQSRGRVVAAMIPSNRTIACCAVNGYGCADVAARGERKDGINRNEIPERMGAFDNSFRSHTQRVAKAVVVPTLECDQGKEARRPQAPCFSRQEGGIHASAKS